MPKVISEMVGGALLGAAANRQVCPTISEMTFGNQSSRQGATFRASDFRVSFGFRASDFGLRLIAYCAGFFTGSVA